MQNLNSINEKRPISLKTILTLACLFSIFSAHAINYELITITNPNNQNDNTGFGAVDHVYQIGKYEVTIAQYTAFLNAVANQADPYKLWNNSMMAPNVQGISRTTVSGGYTYAVMSTSSSGSSSANMPITGVSWFNAARFANWMANGQPNGAESSGTTENGAYNLNGATSGAAPAKNTLNPNTNKAPSYYIPSENEWYKAAYYSPILNNNTGGYYVYATQNNTTPGNLVGSGNNLANYLSDSGNGYCVSQSQLLDSTQTYLTNVGTFVGSPSYYGTFDQSGSVWEWHDSNATRALSRGLRGAAWTSTPPYMQSSYRLITVPSSVSVNVGFRIAHTYP